MDWLGRIAKLRQWTSGGTRAPHKPLSLLHALGRFQQNADSELRYSAVEKDLQSLLTEYGLPNRTTPTYPFHHLVSDGVWELRTDQGHGSPWTGLRILRETGATGRLALELRIALRGEPELLGRIARLLLDLNIPPRNELCEAVGLERRIFVPSVVSCGVRSSPWRVRSISNCGGSCDPGKLRPAP